MGDINFLGNYTLGKVLSWQDSKAATITPISFPGKDSGKTEAIDTLGIIAYINIQGRLIGSFKTIQLNFNGIKGIADGQQTSSQLFKSPFVNATDFSDTRRFGNIGFITTVTPNKCIDSAGGFVFSGIQAGDIVKNLITGDTAYVKTVDSATQLSLVTTIGGSTASNIFTAIGETYAVTATINVKLLSLDIKWELPGLSYCDYTISLIQVA